jgi:shikimate kinase/3-dehydroquinate synthase
MEAVTGAAAPAAGARAAAAPGLVLVGFMGAGKSSAARAVAAELGVPALDSDRELERELGEPIEAFFDREGEGAFRAREQELVVRMLAAADGAVVSLGGGAVGSEAVERALERHLVVHVDVEPDEAWRRSSGKGRPLARDRGRFDQLHEDRRATYESVADASLPPGGRDLVRRALPALLALRDGAAPAGTRLIWAEAESGDYPVFLGRGLLSSGFFHPAKPRRFAVTDANVAAAQAGALASLGTAGVATVAAGEGTKTPAGAEAVLREMARAAVERDDLVVALGGGVVGDLAGFCAAVYQRGIGWTGAPTTLVAQVDSAYGGKTGVDLPEGKNYAGAYHQPTSVLVDPDALVTLPDAELRAGYAEVMKTALIAGGELWARVRRGGAPDERTIEGCLRTKLAIVREDERDAGVRQVLNLGHTLGHAIEAATGFTRFRHGEAVALGLLCALRLSGRDALREEVARLLEARGMAITAPGVDPDSVIELVERDKKRRGGRVPFVLVESPGDVTPGHEIDAADVRTAIAEVT